MRGVTTLETVSYATSPRYVLRQQNVGDAVTQGLELEAKFRAQRPVGGGAADRRARQRQLLPLARQGGARPRQPARPAARLHRQPRPRLPLPRPAAHPRRQRQLDAGLHDPPLGHADRDASARSSSPTSTACGPSARRVALRVTASNLAAADYVVGSAIDGPDLQNVACPRDLADHRADLPQRAVAARAEDLSGAGRPRSARRTAFDLLHFRAPRPGAPRSCLRRPP